MAPTKLCPKCGRVMWAKTEDYRPKGTWVVYQCRNKDCEDYVRSNGRNPYEESIFVDEEKNTRY